MKKPWYIWLSIIGMLVILLSAAKKIFKKRPVDIRLWIRFCGKFFLLFLGAILLPCAALLMLMGWALTINVVLGTILNVIVFVYLYGMGVVVANHLYQWVVKNVE